jgi:hypothetical protein
MKFESPRPQSRLRLGPNGIELTIRYPADTRYAVQVADEISRRARRDCEGSRARPGDARYAEPVATGIGAATRGRSRSVIPGGDRRRWARSAAAVRGRGRRRVGRAAGARGSAAARARTSCAAARRCIESELW